jgi:hypothetical protein
MRCCTDGGFDLSSHFDAIDRLVLPNAMEKFAELDAHPTPTLAINERIADLVPQDVNADIEVMP